MCGISQADAAVTIEREVPVDILNKPYTVAQDGSVWTTYSTSSSTGVIAHLDGQNGSILASFNISFNGYDHPQSIGYANNRVYIVQTPSIYSFRVDGPSGTTNPGLAFSDGETASRLGSNQAFLRVGSDGIGSVALGQTGRVGVLDLNDRHLPVVLSADVLRPRDQRRRERVRGLSRRQPARFAGLRHRRRRPSTTRPTRLPTGTTVSSSRSTTAIG